MDLMNLEGDTNFQRIAEAIDYIRTHFKEQPNLDVVAEKIFLSPHHFQRLFKEWAGVSPKKFLQYISVEHAKTLLKNNGTSLAEAAFETGLSGTGRLHDLFINIEGMTPGEFKNGGALLKINYSYARTQFGTVTVASTAKGICYLAFDKNSSEGLTGLCAHFPNAHFVQVVDLHQQNALQIFNKDWNQLKQVKLHLKGTAFQLKVWETLLKIPFASLASYGSVASMMNSPLASRAVGTAIGSNPVAYLIPCHRVIKSSGIIGEYMWGATRKSAIIGWESAQVCDDYATA
jgi:AraC family transcriptional regulator of adaptative response/methylated-DNA-[protein]-cysteine methyltransferase